jgi:hypothetical protein
MLVIFAGASTMLSFFVWFQFEIPEFIIPVYNSKNHETNVYSAFLAGWFVDVDCPSNVSISYVTTNNAVANGSQIQVKQGEIFSCSATSSPSSSYSWSLDGGNYVKSNQYTVNSVGSHTLTCLAAIDNSTVCPIPTSTINITVLGEWCTVTKNMDVKHIIIFDDISID